MVSLLQIPFIATYRKEECLSLLKDPDVDNQDKSDRTPTLKWHKVQFITQLFEFVFDVCCYEECRSSKNSS